MLQHLAGEEKERERRKNKKKRKNVQLVEIGFVQGLLKYFSKKTKMPDVNYERGQKERKVEKESGVKKGRKKKKEKTEI